jgi:hypothetical protein
MTDEAMSPLRRRMIEDTSRSGPSEFDPAYSLLVSAA